jgi:hypothetical protein
MATFPTPNVALEQQTKQTIVQNQRSGLNAYAGNPIDVINAAAVSGGLWTLVVSDTSTAFTISGSAGVSSSLTGASTVAAALSGVGTAIGSSIYYTSPSPGVGIDQLFNHKVVIEIPTGATIGVAVASGVTATATLTNVVLVSGGENAAFPSYTNSPYLVPNWTDQFIVHAYPVGGFGNTTADTTKTVEVQVKQIQTGEGPSGGNETQEWTEYFANYQINLNQTDQVLANRTKLQN